MGCRLNRIWPLWANGVGALVCGQPKRLSIYPLQPPLSIARIKHGLCLGCFVTAFQGWGVLGGTGAQCTANGKRQRVGGALRYHGPCIFISFSALEQGGPSGGALPQRYHFWGARLREYPFSIPSPLVTRGPKTKKPLNQRLIFFPCLFSDIELISF